MVGLLGNRDELLRIIEDNFDAAIFVRGNEIQIQGDEAVVADVAHLFEDLITLLVSGQHLDVEVVMRTIDIVEKGAAPAEVLGRTVLTTPVKTVRPKSFGQRQYVDALETNTVTFAIGPAGTGKTYLAMAEAIRVLQSGSVQRIVLTRPAVEAGEKLGFLPGDLLAKVDPYLRPLYDALYDIVGTNTGSMLLQRGTVEVAPLAYMRGRTLNDSFIILDEAQNTTREQMKMFLTRLGFGSRAVVTGDITQMDLRGGESGLVGLPDEILRIDSVSLVTLGAADVVRHRIVAAIVDAYARSERSSRNVTKLEDGGGPRAVEQH